MTFVLSMLSTSMYVNHNADKNQTIFLDYRLMRNIVLPEDPFLPGHRNRRLRAIDGNMNNVGLTSDVVFNGRD
ncbi:hypothetical protein RR46_14791 [Papilio xuthus]|uniref:Uncharacterized protein n=1 Tax=Papilio xuthus TaxID=66420 RepID=A0A194PDG2_PAPXU|nr:hypothetical protein RR46_14791 [Papilio xuthus]